jgi:transposase
MHAHASIAPATAICAALYMPALVAVRHDPHLRALHQALLARHKAKLQALIAVARKMLHAIFGIFRYHSPYDGSRLRQDIKPSSSAAAS